MKYIEPGTLLISPPAMPDPKFGQTVLLLTQHSPHGAFALCLNRPTNQKVDKILEEMNIDAHLPFKMYWGGPLHPGSIWMIHTKDWNIDHTLHVDDTWKITSHESMFHHLADGDAPRSFRLAYGFASWGPGQLEAELSGTGRYVPGSSWLVLPDTDAADIFEIPENKLWSRATTMAASAAVDSWI